MKNVRSVELQRGQQQPKMGQYTNIERKTYSPSHQNVQNRLNQYENLAKKAKDQLKDFENKRKGSPQSNRYQAIEEEKNNQKEKGTHGSKTKPYQKTLQHNYSHKVFKKESIKEFTRPIQRDQKMREVGVEQTRREKLSADVKMDSPRKRHYVDSNEYKKLHDKLDVIENKISDMKKNLQKKKEEKLRQQESKQKAEKENEVSKKGLKDLVTKVPDHSDLHTFQANPYSPRHNVYYVSELVRAYKDEQSLAREHLLTSLNILRVLEKSKCMSAEDLRKNKLSLPFKKGYQEKKTIVFDLDETLIHCNDTLNPPYDVKLPIKFPTGELIEAGVNIRPYAKQILKNLSRYFQIIVFTASHACYANVVINHLDPNNEWVHHRLFREHCFLSAEGMYVKDLRVINRDLKNMVLVDNAAYSYAYQLENGIPILPYYHGQIDFELKMLEDYLMRMMICKDVREINNKTFKLGEYRKYIHAPEKLVEELYLNQ